jgi:hypothetical protein
MRALGVLLLPSLMLLMPSRVAAAPRRYAIGEIRVEGDVAGAERRDVEERAWRTLALLLPADATLAPEDAVERALARVPELRGCGDDRCNLQLGDRLGVERLITLRIERRDEAWTARLLDYAVDAAQVAGTLEVPCRGCDVTALFDALGRAFASLVGSDVSRPLCRLAVASRPVAATVAVDAVPLGRAPWSHTIAAGRHTITVDEAQFARGQAEVDCPSGGVQDLAFTLSAERSFAVAHEGHAMRPRRALVAIGATSAVLFGAAVAGLAVAGAYDGRPACEGPRCAFRYDTDPAVAVAAVAVVVFGAAGVSLLATGLRRVRF